MRTFSDPAVIAAHIIDHTDGQIRMALPLGLGKANTIVNALTDAAIEDASITLKIVTALTLERPVPESGWASIGRSATTFPPTTRMPMTTSLKVSQM